LKLDLDKDNIHCFLESLNLFNDPFIKTYSHRGDSVIRGIPPVRCGDRQ